MNTTLLTKMIADKFLAGEIVSLDKYSEITDDAAEVLANHEGDLSLDGLTRLSDAAAEALAKHKVGSLKLNGLTSLSRCGQVDTLISQQTDTTPPPQPHKPQMNLKTATLITIIGNSIVFFYWQCISFNQNIHQDHGWFPALIGLVSGLLSTGTLILFLITLYTKQK